MKLNCKSISNLFPRLKERSF